MGLPLAVAPSVRTPGLALLINLLAGVASPGSQPYKALAIAPKSSAGTITPDTQVIHSLAGASDGQTYLGPGTPGHLALKRLFEECPLGQVDLVSPLVSGGVAATGTWTFSGAPTSPLTVLLKVAGRTATFTWNGGDSATTAAANAATALTGLANDTPLTYSPSTGVVTGTARYAGTWGNDVQISVTLVGTITGAAACVTSGATLTSGTLAPDLTNVLALVSTSEYDLILDAASGNTDATTASGSTTVSQLNAGIAAIDSGFNAKLQQGVYGVTSTLSAAMTGTGQQNAGWMQCIFGEGFLSLPAELGAAELGARLREEQIDPAVNRIEMEYRCTLYPPTDLVTYRLTNVQVESALQNGITPVDYNASNQPRPKRPITTYFKDTNGNPDDRLLDVSRVSGTYAIAKDLRINLPIEFKGAKLSPDLAPNADPPPAGTVEERDIKSFVVSRLRFWVKQGVAQQATLDQSIADGSLIVQVDSIDSSQVDIVIPETIVPPLAKFSTVLNHIGK